MHEINIDSVVDYPREYRTRIEKASVRGDRLTGLCPFHDDKNASFSVDLKTGRFNCFACGESGNYTSFYAKLNGIDTSEAYKRILDEYHVSSQPAGPYIPEVYAAEKRLPLDWLTDTCHLGSGEDKRIGATWVRIPYYSEGNKEQTFRKRYRPGSERRFAWKYGSTLLLYGEWRLPEIRTAKYAILVEGESDAQTLWYLGRPALGVPGASTYKPEWTERLKGVERLYLHIEPDTGGKTFLSQMTQKLRDGKYEGQVFTWSCSQYGAKDPSELYIKQGEEEAKRDIEDAVKNAKPVDIYNEDVPEAVSGAPIRLRQPEGWFYSEKGISKLDTHSDSLTLVCRTPIILTRRIKSMDTGDEKVEVAYKRDGVWHTNIQPRSVVFQSRAITCLADLGCTITSENSKQVVKFLEALEAENFDVLERINSTSTFGWQSTKEFLPSHAPGVVLDIDPSLRGWAAAYEQRGTYDAWKQMVAPHRERDKFRFILAAAFTAPLLKIIQQRIFFVYNWGGSKGGKTAALKAALSVWGDPEKLMVNFNATSVALERIAGFFCDLPMGIDERQLAGQNQASLEKLVYMISSGTGRARGSKTGGLQALQTWRTVAMATGEEPLATETSETGVSTRVLELYGAPFDDEPSASLMHQQTALIHGWAGPDFINHIIDEGEDKIRARYADVLAYVYQCNDGKNGAHAASIAAVTLADAMASEWIFGMDRTEAEVRAQKMADAIVEEIRSSDLRDVNENAAQFVIDWILSNTVKFSHDNKYGPCYGEMEDDVTYVFPSLLQTALTDAGYSSRKAIKYMAEQGIIKTFTYANGGKVYQTVRRMNSKLCRVIAVDLKIARGEQTKYDVTKFQEIVDDEPLPF